MYKVVASYQPSEEVVEGGSASEFLRAEKGDILIDGEIIDEIWFKAKSTITEKMGRIPRECVVLFCNSGKKDSLVLNCSDCESERTEKLCNDGHKFLDVCDIEEKHGAESDGRREANYAHMASEDTASITPVIVDNTINPLSKQSHTNNVVKLPEKLLDEGYGSYYSGETNENIQPLLPPTSVASKQDEAGYEIPEIDIDSFDMTIKSDDGSKGKKRRLKDIFLARTSTQSSKHRTKVDDFTEKYYNPPADIRDNYFLPKLHCPIVRVLLSLIVSLAVAFTSLFTLLISHHLLFSFSISFILFIVVFVIPVTLLHRGFLCVLALIFPCIFSTRTKIAALVLLVALLIVGPIVGIANKVDVATTCNANPEKGMNSKFWKPSLLKGPSASISPHFQPLMSQDVHEECKKLFGSIDTKCDTIFHKLRQHCNKGMLNNVDKELCKKSREEFCVGNYTFTRSCYLYVPKDLDTAEHVRRIISYLLPLLILFLLSDAYSYNKIYLTTKDADNIYITQRLKELDCERKNRGLTDLILPLTRIEFHSYLLRGRCALSNTEKESMIRWLFILSMFSFIALCFILIEDRINMALLNTLVQPCLEVYKINMDIKYRLYIYGLLGILLLVVLVQSYALRLRSIICDSFYHDMVDIRSKHLYYKILHDRHSFGRHVRRKIQLLAESKRMKRRISCVNMLYHILPHAVKWLCMKLSVRRCMICDAITCYKTVSCREGNCLAHYCYECYVDAGQQCLTCKIPNSPPPPNTKPNPVAL